MREEWRDLPKPNSPLVRCGLFSYLTDGILYLCIVSDIKIIEQPKGQKLRVQEVSKLSCGAKTPNMDRKLNYEWYHVDGGRVTLHIW